MAPGRSTEPARLRPWERAQLLELARQAIAAGARGLDLRVADEDLPPALKARGACFVTLARNGRLHGCIGTLEPHRSLAADVAANARAAAFFDPRAPRVRSEELGQLEIEISVLSALEPFSPANETALHESLIPAVTGLVIAGAREGRERRATFLPSVWEKIPDPRSFVAQLKLKAGLPEAAPVSDLRFWRYTVEAFASTG